MKKNSKLKTGLLKLPYLDKMRLMRINAKKTLRIVLLLMAILLSSVAMAEETSAETRNGDEKATSVQVPDISEVIPMAAELSGRLAVLENKVQGDLDLILMEKKSAQIKTNVNTYALELQALRDSGDYRTTRLIVLRQVIEGENERLSVISKPLRKEVHRLGTWRQQWLTEQQRWNQWQSAWLENGAPEQIHSVFTEANDTIAAGLNLIAPQLEIILTEQGKVGDIQEQIYTLDAELEGLIMDKRFGTFFYSSPPMFSSRYFSQFTIDMWKASLESFNGIMWSGSEFLDRLVWGILIEVFAFLVLSISLYRKREVLKESKYWCFIADRTFSAALFLVCTIMMLIYEYEEFPFLWKFFNLIIVGISFARLAGNLAEVPWKKGFVYGLTIFLVTIRFMEVFDFPLPLFRIFIVLAGAVGLICCWKWGGENKCHEGPLFYTGLLRLVSVFFGIIVAAEIWGKDVLVFYLLDSVTKSISLVLVFLLVSRMIHGLVDWLFHTSKLRKAVVLYSNDIDSIIQRFMNFICIALWGLILLPGILMIWGIYDSLEKATKGFLEFGFNVGSQPISVGLVIIVITVLYSSSFVSWIFQKLFLDVLLRKRKVQRGVRLSFERLIHYVVIFIGFLLAISVLGFDLTKFTIIISALGVGIGFGLQGVVNNFVSGIILLFEQPVRQGDIIEVNGIWAEVKKIGLRATTVQTFDQADLIIPNADLTTNQVTNWTLSSRQVRLIIPVGVAYGSDVELVFEMLTECAKSNEMVAKNPEPQVLFLRFGDSSLDFELRVWIHDTTHRLTTKSQLHQEIDRRFREKNIVIAFPQRDLHIRSMDESVEMTPETNK